MRGAPVREAANTEDDATWRALNALRPDSVTWTDTRRLMLDAQEAYQTNPIAYAAVEAHANLVVSGGLMVTTPDPEAAAILDAWFTAPASGMRERAYRIAAELALYGEVFLRTFVDATTGECVMRNLDPVLVEDIRIDPEDPEMATAYLYRPLTVTGAPTKAQWIDAATVDHWTVNAVGGSPRGRSDLAVVLPWLSRYKEWLIDRVRLNKLKASFVYEVTINGARRDDLEALRREYAERLVKQRTHQQGFRRRVLAAYGNQCALCRLQHIPLLDAAHIREDSEGGEPIVPNGIAMCAIHHRAFESEVIGIRPDYVIEVQARVLLEKDGPTLQHALQGVHNTALQVPKQVSARPDVVLLEERYERFLKAG